MTTFQGGTIYWSAATRAHVLYGDIRAEYNATANERDAYGTVVQRILGMPTSDEAGVPGVPGDRMTTFQGGTIYWSAATRAHVVYGGIGSLYNSLGGPTSFLGLPISDECPTTPTAGLVTSRMVGQSFGLPAAGPRGVGRVVDRPAQHRLHRL